jgi:hypothetical protein
MPTHTQNPEYRGGMGLRSGASGFTDPPSILLHGIEGVRWAIDEANLPEWKSHHKHPFEYCVHSDWIIGLIDEIAATGKYPYNADVHRLARQRLGLPALSEAENAKEGTPLSLLIYNAQGFRRDRDLRAKGLEPLTQEMIDEAKKTNRQIELADATRCNVREVEGRNYAFRPRKRTHAIGLTSPAKIVARRRRK